MMKSNKAVPFDIESGKIKVAFADVAGNKENIKSIKMMLLNKGLVMEPYMAFETNIEEYFSQFESKIEENMGDLEETSSVTDLIDNIIKLAIEKRASDIHIEPQTDSVRVRFRIDGELMVMANIGKEKQPQMIGRLKAISICIKKDRNHKMVEFYYMIITIFVYLHKKIFMVKNLF